MKQVQPPNDKKTLINNFLFSVLFPFILTLLLYCGTSAIVLGQNEEINYEELIYFEADPFAYINDGYSIHLGYENWGWRLDLTKVKVDFPEGF